MNFRNITRKLLSNNQNITVYDEPLSLAYHSGSLIGSQLQNKNVLVVYNEDSLYQEIKYRLESEKAIVRSIFLHDDVTEQPIENCVDFLIILIDWTPKVEMMRLKTISSKTYDDFFSLFATIPLQISKNVISANKYAQIISVLPAFSFERAYGYTLYGMLAQYLNCNLELIVNSFKTSNYINVLYSNYIKDKQSVKTFFLSDDGSYNYLLKEQIIAVILLVCSNIGRLIIQSKIIVGMNSSRNMNLPLLNQRVFSSLRNSFCGGTLSDSNIVFVHNNFDSCKVFENYFREEKCYCSSVYCEDYIVDKDLRTALNGMVGFCDVIINVLFNSKRRSPLMQLYRWLQVESPFLTSQDRQVSICNIFVSDDNDLMMKYGKSIEKLNESLALLLNNHKFVVNGIIAYSSVNLNDIAKLSAFLSSKYGEALTGETICLG